MIRVGHSDGISTITLDRPDRRNALTPEMLERLAHEIPAAAAISRVILLAGEGKVFCAGFDLSLCRDDDSGRVMRELLTGLSRVILALRSAPLPVVVSAHGAAIAGGCALLGGGDLVVTNDGATLGYPVTRLGISPAVSAPFVREAAGDGPCRERMLDSGLVSGIEAVRLGLAHESVHSAEGVLVRAREIALSLASKPAGALRATKLWLHELSRVDRTAERALAASLSLAGSHEERSRLASLWKPAGSP